MAPKKQVHFASHDDFRTISARSFPVHKEKELIPLQLVSADEPRPVYSSYDRFAEKKLTLLQNALSLSPDEYKVLTPDSHLRSIPLSPALSPLPSLSPTTWSYLEEVADGATLSKDLKGQWWMRSEEYHLLNKSVHRAVVIRKVRSRVRIEADRRFQKEQVKQLDQALEAWASRGDLKHEAWMASRFPEMIPNVPETIEEIQTKRAEFAVSRTQLKASGCHPCYAAEIQYPFPVNEPPLIEALGGYENALSTQIESWDSFTDFRLDEVEWRGIDWWRDDVKKHREKFGLQGHYESQLMIWDQEVLTTWAEYQTYEMRECSYDEASYDTRAYDIFRRNLKSFINYGSAESKRSELRSKRYELRGLAKALKRHSHYLPWIEERRRELELEFEKKNAEIIQEKARSTTSQEPNNTGEVAASDSTDDEAVVQNADKVSQTKTDAHAGDPDPESPLSPLPSQTPTPPLDKRKKERVSESSPGPLSNTPEAPLMDAENHAPAQTGIKRSRAGRVLKRPVRYSEQSHSDDRRTAGRNTRTKRPKSKKRKGTQTRTGGVSGDRQKEGPRKKSTTESSLAAGKPTPGPYKTAGGRDVKAPRRWPELE